MNIAAMEQEALLHLRRSIGTSAGMHKAQLRKHAERLRAENERPKLEWLEHRDEWAAIPPSFRG
jgi:hypothetical protein